jgi:hypothetical protein
VTPNVRPLEAKDFDAWLPLWYGYNSFYRNEVAAEVTENTCRRLHENTDGFFGWVAAGRVRPREAAGAPPDEG